MTEDAATHVAERYGRFARDEAPGRSALYGDWAAGVAGDPEVQAVLARIEPHHRQPPLVFAVSRMLGAPQATYPTWSAWVRAHADELVAECGRRSIQTNDPLRCAAMLPALSLIEGPIALLEVGASAGLCLYPDRYAYRYETDEGEIALGPAGAAAGAVLRSRLYAHRTDAPMLRMPEVVWRAGTDLAPLDAANPGDRGFLASLVWPGETGRAERITAALDVVAADPPMLVAGDATDPELLDSIAARAPSDATLVVSTVGLLPHVGRNGRERLIRGIRSLPARWLWLDPPGLHEHAVAPAGARTHGFVLGMDAAALAIADPLGGFVEWLR